ncbi:MAG: hypothetical protein R3F19_14855 [Verrucomicrobiales bacterium]
MKTAISIASAISTISFLWGEPEPIDFSKLQAPPMEAVAGKTQDGIQIGLWTEKAIYHGDEIRNIWIIARKKGTSNTTIGVGGNLFRESFLYIYRDGIEVKKIPQQGGSDGVRDAIGFSGGISSFLNGLPNGTYQMIWKTEQFASNSITVTFK